MTVDVDELEAYAEVCPLTNMDIELKTNLMLSWRVFSERRGIEMVSAL
jgi:hypothetical protein